jgi:amino acid transporter
MFPRLKRILLGSPLHSTELHEQRLSKKAALTVFASDNLSSAAYATEEILLVLVLAGAAAIPSVFPVATAIALLLIIVVFSYAQLIHAYPSGGGAYTVAKENLGITAGLVAASALLIDYVLTVAVSVAAGIAAITSAFPALFPHRIAIGVLAIVLVLLANLRGVRESARVFAFPVYTFIVATFIMIAMGLWRHFAEGVTIPAPPIPDAQPQLLTLFLLLRAFSQGCTALTGVEAVSNGVQAFQKPVVRNAQITLYVMAAILGLMFMGISYVAYEFGIVPTRDGSDTVLSQMARIAFGSGSAMYYLLQFSTMAILLLAANTCFAGFPRLASILAEDKFVPRQLANLGDRLVFSNGIFVLGLLAGMLLVGFAGSVHALLPLYAIGVFLSFTLSQAGLVVHWKNSTAPGRGWRLALNTLGAVVTFAVLLIITYFKFFEGAWVIVFAVPLIMLVFWKTRRHYFKASRQLSLSGVERPRVARHTVIVPVAPVPNRVVLSAVEYARSISRDVMAVTVNSDTLAHDEILANWKRLFDDVPLIVLQSPYRSVVRPFLRFVDEVQDLRHDDHVTVILPESVPARWWHNLLHNQTSLILKGALLFRPGIVVTSVPTHLRE